MLDALLIRGFNSDQKLGSVDLSTLSSRRPSSGLRFLLEHLVAERNLARNTQHSYRDTLRLLLPRAAKLASKPIDRLIISDLSADVVRGFLASLESERSCSINTRNQRLAAIHAFARFIGERNPEALVWCGEVRGVPFKRTGKKSRSYLEKAEMDALLAAPDQQTAQGRRDHALLLFLYNSVHARAKLLI